MIYLLYFAYPEKCWIMFKNRVLDGFGFGCWISICSLLCHNTGGPCLWPFKVCCSGSVFCVLTVCWGGVGWWGEEKAVRVWKLRLSEMMTAESCGSCQTSNASLLFPCSLNRPRDQVSLQLYWNSFAVVLVWAEVGTAAWLCNCWLCHLSV